MKKIRIAQIGFNALSHATAIFDTLKKYPDVYAMAHAEYADVEKLVFSCGVYKVKAANIVDFSRIIALLNNNLSASEMEAGIADIQNTLVARGFIDRQGNVLLENIRFKLGSEYNSAWNNN